MRSLSSSSASAKMIKPPIQVFGVEGRYAAALYSAGSKTKTLDAVEKELISFQNSIKTDSKLKEFIVNPSLKRNLKVEALRHVATKVCLEIVYFYRLRFVGTKKVITINWYYFTSCVFHLNQSLFKLSILKYVVFVRKQDRKKDLRKTIGIPILFWRSTYYSKNVALRYYIKHIYLIIDESFTGHWKLTVSSC